MPTALPLRREDDCAFPGVALFVVPLAILCLSVVLQGEDLTAPGLVRVLLRGGEALAEIELGFGLHWAERIARGG